MDLRKKGLFLIFALLILAASCGGGGGSDGNGNDGGGDGDGGGNGNAEIVLVRVFAGVPLDAPVEGSASLRPDGYPITYGTSFIYALEFTADGPVAYDLLTYGHTGDPTDPAFSAETQRFSAKDWRQVLFTDAAIGADPGLVTYDVG